MNKFRHFLVVLVTLCVFMYLGNKVFMSSSKRQGVILQGTTTSALHGLAESQMSGQVSNAGGRKRHPKLSDMARNPILSLPISSSSEDSSRDVAISRSPPAFPSSKGVAISRSPPAFPSSKDVAISRSPPAFPSSKGVAISRSPPAFPNSKDVAISRSPPAFPSSKDVAISRSLPSPSAALTDFDPHGNDTLVVIHTQKTGGSEFLRHLMTLKWQGEYLCALPSEHKERIEELHKVPRRGGKKIERAKGSKVRKDHTMTQCPRDPSKPDGEQWLIAEKTVRWLCGVHASYTEYSRCLPALNDPKINMKRHVHYAILLRHPVLRYLSEYFHVQRNATWSSPRWCGGKVVSEAEMPPCYPGYYHGKPWTNLTLSKYVSCESNWGNNRQTMMLADLESVHCFNKSALSREERDRRLLTSAKNNLEAFSYFGLTEYMSESCSLFEKTFGMSFAVRPDTRNLTDLHSSPVLLNLWNDSTLYEAIERANHLDVQLYEYALELFVERAGQVGIAVNRELVDEEVRLIRTHPHLLDKSAQKHAKLNFRIS